MLLGASVLGREPVFPLSSTTTVTAKVPFQSAEVPGPPASGSGSRTTIASIRLLISVSVPVNTTDRPSPEMTAVPPAPPTAVIAKPDGTETVAVRMLVACASWSLMSMLLSVTVPPASATVSGVPSMCEGSLMADGNTVR